MSADFDSLKMVTSVCEALAFCGIIGTYINLLDIHLFLNPDCLSQCMADSMC